MSTKVSVFCLLVMLGGLSACQSTDQQLKQAAQQRWAALISGNFTEAYQYYTEAFQQSTPLDLFKHKVRGTGLWNKAQVKTVNCEDGGKRCIVDVEVTVSMKMRGLTKPVETRDTVRETWVKTGWFSDWRYVKE